jgi:hypothetical protein
MFMSQGRRREKKKYLYLRLNPAPTAQTSRSFLLVLEARIMTMCNTTISSGSHFSINSRSNPQLHSHILGGSPLSERRKT